MRKKLLYQNFNALASLKGVALVSALSLIFFMITSPAGGQAQLLKDIDTTEEPYYNEYTELINAGSLIYFIAHNELWKSGGSTGNTVRLKKFRSISNLTLVGPKIYFTADDGISGAELWKSEGSVATTVKVKDILPGSAGSFPENLTGGYGVLYFVANNGVNGKELWKSDGTDAGTFMVKDILKISGSSQPNYLTHIDKVVYFAANDGINGYELWKSDGTASGTVMVKDIMTGSKKSSSPSALVAVNNILYFAASDNTTGSELWRSDGTTAGTFRLKDIRSGTAGSGVQNTIDVFGTLFFTANDGVHGDELWKSNGTPAGTVLVKDMNPGSAGSNSTDAFSRPMGDFANINGILYFVASKGTTDYIYRSDGTSAGTFAIQQAIGANINRVKPEFSYANGKVFYLNNVNGGYSLVSMPYNGTTPSAVRGFIMPYDYYEYVRQEMISFKDMVYTYGRISDEDIGDPGYKFIRSDGTYDGTVVVKDAFKSTWGSDPRDMATFKNKVFLRISGFLADTEYLWITDGTSAGTQFFAELNYDYEWEVVNDWFYYTARGFSNGRWGWELWKTQGTPETSHMVHNQSTAEVEEQFPRNMTAVGNTLYFHDNNGGLWMSQVQGEGHVTGKLAQFENVVSITDVGGTAFILADVAGHLELWKSVPTGVAKAVTLSNQNSTNNRQTIAINNILYFVADDAQHGMEVWRTDGTTSGTYMMTDVHQSDLGYEDIGTLASYKNQLHVSGIDNDGNWIVFRATDASHLEGFYDFPGKAEKMVEFNGYLIVFAFSGDDESYHEVWTSDGTSWGTRYMTTIWRDNFMPWQTPIDYAIIGNAMFFGMEYSDFLWRTNGVCAETVNTGAEMAYAMAPLGKSLIFGGSTFEYGWEPYIYRNIPQATQCASATSLASAPEEMTTDGSPSNILTPYPNPFTDEFTMRVNGNEDEVAQVAVYTPSGLPVETFENVKANTDYNKIGAGWPRGMYVIKVRKGESVSTHMVVKK
jgi:ELWxxDGT repeat protein